MKRRIVSILMALTMALSLLPAQVLAQELTQLGQNSAYTTGEDAVPLTYGNGQDTALHAIALQSIGPNEAAVANDLYGLMSVQTDYIKLVDDIDDVGTLAIDYDVTFDLNGHVLKGFGSGSVFKIEKNGHLTITDSNPTAEHKFTPNADGLWVLDTNGDKTVKGGVITGGSATGSSASSSGNGGGVLIEGGGKLTMDGGSIVGCVSDKGAGNSTCGNGGGVYVAGGGEFEMNSGAAIIGCVSKSTDHFGGAGGGVNVAENGTFTMNGGNIRNCKALYGGGVYDFGTFTMSSGTIRDCAVTNEYGSGAAITSQGMTLTINGTVISDGACPVYVQHTSLVGTVIIGADADIQANVQFHRCAAVYANGGTVKGDVLAVYSIPIIVGEGVTQSTNIYGKLTLEEGSHYADGVVAVTYQANGTDYATQILKSGGTATKPAIDPTNSANTAFLDWYNGEEKYDFTQPVTENLTLTARFAAVTKKVETEKELTDALADDTVDIIQMGSDIKINATLIVDRPVTLDLVGYMLEMANNASGSVFKVENGGHLTLIDSNSTAEHKFTPNADGLWVLDETGGTETVNGGVIYGGNTTDDGGGVLIEGGGQFTMTGGSIVGCSADSGGGVKVECGDANGTFTMTGGKIIGCVARHGGGVETDSGGEGEYGTFIMNGGVIDSCVATDGRGGGVYASGPFTMGKDAAITNCKASEEGGGVFLGSSKSPHTLNGTITSEDANDGDYIFANNAQVTIGANAKINANITLAGNTIEMDANAKFTGKVTVIGGSMYTPVATAKEFTTALYNTGVSTIRLTNDIIVSGNSLKAIQNNRQVTLDLNGYVLDLGERYIAVGGNTPGTLTIMDSRPEVEHKFSDDGTGLWVLDTNGDKIVKGGIITGSTGTNDGAIHVGSTGQLIMTGGNIVGHKNNNGLGGGGVYVSTGGQFTMSGGSIAGCQATGTSAYGGGVFVKAGGTFTMSGGSITGCTAVATASSGYACGGGIRSEGNTTLSGTAEIRDCHAKGGDWQSGGGISDGNKDGSLSISGNVQIIGCTADGDSDAMYIMSGANKSITGGTFYGSIKGRDKISGIIVTYQVNGKDYATQVVPSDSSARLLDPTKQGYALDGWYTADGTRLDAATSVTESLALTGWLYAPVTNEQELTTALANNTIDVIRLTNDITLTAELQITPGRKVTLDLNGHVLNLGKRYISVSGTVDSFSTLTIMDSDPTKEHKFTDTDGLWVLDANGDKLVKGGVITGGSNTSGGAMVVDWWATVTMNGGNIVGCSASESGGAVCSTSNLPFTMNGGSIAGCTAANGSAIHLKGSQMYANGGTVNGTVLVDVSGNNIGTIGGSGSTSFNDLIINKDAKATFSRAHSPLGIVENKPGTGSSTYHTVTFDPVDSTMEHTTRYFLNDGKISSEIVPASRTGYTFDGWYNGDTKWDHDSDTVAGDLTLTAHWTANTYTVTLNANGGTVNPATITVTHGAALPAMPVPVYAGYAFMGWYDAQTGGKCYGDKTGASTSSYDKTENCTLYARWSECDHSGSTAKPTCTDDATCTVCQGTIGKLNHDWEQTWTSGETSHWHKCLRCDAKNDEAQHADPDKDHLCDTCGKELTQCDDTNKDHKCDLCGKELSQCADIDKDHVCDYCGKTISNHEDANKDHVCDYCGKTVSNHEDANKDHVCDYCGKTVSNHEDADKDHVCDYCGKTVSNHDDANKDHVCDYCGKTVSNHEDADKDHNCDLCGKVLTVHTGGKATCIAPAVCELCGQSYGDIDPAAHADLRHIPAKAATTEAVGSIEYWYCTGCDKYYQDAAAKLQITQADTVTPQRIPHHYSGPTIMVVGTSYYDGGNTGLTFISSAAYSGFKGVQVDGETLAAKNYTSRENGGSQVCLKPDYLRGLTNGDHIVTILSAEGDVAAVFTVSVTGVSGSKNSPTTFDPGVTVYAAAALVSLTGLTLLPRKRREDD